MKTIYIFLLIACALFTANAQNKYYVNSKSGAYSGRSWNLANNDLQGIVNKASPGDTVFVAAGIYKGGFFMREGVIVIGGYTANVNMPAERIYPGEAIDESQLSILNGEGNQRVLTQIGDFFTPTYWEGFVIQNGKPSVNLQPGSIIYAANGSKEAAGIVYKYDAALKKGMMIGLEEAKKQWGGYQSETPELPYLGAIENIQSESGGKNNSEKIIQAFGNTNMDFTHSGYELNGNYAAKWCQSLASGGYTDWFLPSCYDMYEIAQEKTAVNNTLISLNKQLKNGYWTSSHVGDLLAWTFYFESDLMSGALKYLEKNVRPVREFQLTGDLDDIYYAGGGAFLKNNGMLMNCIIRNNETPSQGGGIYMERGAQALGCLIHNNTAEKGGAGIYASTDETAEARFLFIRNSTVANNTNGSGVITEGSGVRIENAIIWGNTDRNNLPANINRMDGVAYSCVQDGEKDNGNINENPLFTNAEANDFTLQENSPCLKTGNVASVTATRFFLRDLKGYTRVIFQEGDSFADMGAFQHGETDHFLNSIHRVNQHSSGIRVYPNALKCGEQVTIVSDKSYKELQISIIDNAGRVLATKKTAENTSVMNVPSQAGIYYLKINAGNTSETHKLLIYK